MFPVVDLLSNSFELQGIEVNLWLFIVLMGLGSLVFFPIFLFYFWFVERKRLRSNKITASFIPPNNFNPAELSVFFYKKLDERSVAATIIHLLHRGVVNIKKVKGHKVVYPGPKVDNSLRSYEKTILKYVESFDGYYFNSLVKDLSAGRQFSKKTFTESVINDLAKRKYISSNSKLRFFKVSLKLCLFVLIVLVLYPFILVIVLTILREGASSFRVFTDLAYFFLYLSVISFLPLFILSMLLVGLIGRVNGRRWVASSKTKRYWIQVVSFRNYVQLVEKEKLTYNSPDLKKKILNDTLPYSISLRFVKNWQDIIS